MKITKKEGLKGIRIKHNKTLFWIIIALLILLILLIVYIRVIGKDEEDVLLSEEEFCGISTNDGCELVGDCVVVGCSGQVCQNKNNEMTTTTCEYRDCYNHEKYMMQCTCYEEKCMWKRFLKL